MKRTVAIVGRPNVGKSTLFNRIVGGRTAIVDDRPGVTRDRNFAATEWAGRTFWLVDTGGWVEGDRDSLSRAIRHQVELAVSQADAVLLVVDAQDGLHPADLEMAQLLRPHRSRVVVAVNKADELPDTLDHHAFHELGLGEPRPVSAATGKGTGDLLDTVVEHLPQTPAAEDEDAVQVAVVGRPNVGKSSLVNKLLGEERAVVAPEAGTTRDAVDSPLRYHGKTLNFIDTAGLRKRSKVEDEIEFYSTLRTDRAIDRADVCVVVIDAVQGVHAQDLKVLSKAWERGTGVVVAVNKWDLVSDKGPDTAVRGRREVVSRAPFLAAAPFEYVSALSGQRVRKLLDVIVRVAETRHERTPTAEVNRVLRDLVARNQPPQRRGREVKILYGSQIGVAPPTFAVVTNHPDAIPESYRRYLEHGLRRSWAFEGTPIRIRFRRKRDTR